MGTNAPRSLALAVAALIAFACATAPERPAPRAVVLAPVSYQANPSASLAPGVTPAGEELARLLTARGVIVVALPADEFRAVWSEATQDLGTLADGRGGLDPARLDAAARAASAALHARGVRFDALLLPWLELRYVEILGNGVAWDGVERRVPIERTVAKRLGNWPNHELAPCVSLRLLAYGADGARWFDESGGVDVASRYEVRLLAERPRPDLFADRASLRQGAELALAPLFAGEGNR